MFKVISGFPVFTNLVFYVVTSSNYYGSSNNEQRYGSKVNFEYKMYLFGSRFIRASMNPTFQMRSDVLGTKPHCFIEDLIHSTCSPLSKLQALHAVTWDGQHQRAPLD